MEQNERVCARMPIGLALGILRLAEQSCSSLVLVSVPEVMGEEVRVLEDREVGLPIDLLEALSVLIGEWKDPADRMFYQGEIRRMIEAVKAEQQLAARLAAINRIEQIDRYLAGKFYGGAK